MAETGARQLAEIVDADGNATLGGNLVIPDGGTIGSASATGAIAIDNSGKVGIGTTNPTYKLEIAAGQPWIRLNDTDGTTAYAEILTSSGSLSLSANPLGTGLNSYIAAYINGTERMRIDTSGNVELKTTNAKLILPTGGGISFPDATQINSATDDDATLSTYETGYVLNPIYVGGSQYNLNNAEDQLHYIRIGDLVYLTGEIDSSGATNTATGAITLKLPFTSASSAGGNLTSSDNGQRAYVGSTAYACSITIFEGSTEALVRQAITSANFSVTSNQRVVLNVCFCYYAA